MSGAENDHNRQLKCMRNAGVSQSAFMQMAIGERHPIETEIYSRCVDGAFIGLADVSSEASRNVLC